MDLDKTLLSEASVALLPGSDFYMPPGSLTARMATVDYDGGELYRAAEDIDFKLDPDFVAEWAPHISEGLNALESFIKAL